MSNSTLQEFDEPEKIVPRARAIWDGEIVTASTLQQKEERKKEVKLAKSGQVLKPNHITHPDNPLKVPAPYGEKARQSSANTRRFRKLLLEEGFKELPGIDGETKPRLQRVVEAIYLAAESGQAWAAQLLAERIDGKSPIIIPDGNNDTVVMIVRGASTDDL